MLRIDSLFAVFCLACAFAGCSSDGKDSLTTREPTAQAPSNPAPTAGAAAPTGDPGATTPGTLDYNQLHHCGSVEPADARDALLSGKPDALPYQDGVDLVLPQTVLDWMTERRWQPSHDGWHNIRRCADTAAAVPNPNAPPPPFQTTQPEAVAHVCAQTALVPAHRECEDARDGYEFLVMHRHMLHSLRQAFPGHSELFAGFPSFPFHVEDVPEEWRDRWNVGGFVRADKGETGWDPQIIEVAQRLEAIGGTNDGGFASEGELGMFIQCGMTTARPLGMRGPVSIHGALHFKWVVQDSPHALGKQTANIENYMFWKLHGWIDDVWERYRQVKGLSADPADPLEAEIAKQCWQMHELGHVVDTSCQDKQVTLPAESGVFHDMVRPILDHTCQGCHSECSPSGNVSLGGRISSADIVSNLVNRKSFSGGQFKLVVPGKPLESWFYLKAAGLAAMAGCKGRCLTQTMPPTGMTPTLTAAELAAIYAWIEGGAD